MPLSYCSDSDPLEGVYLATISTKASAKDWMDEVREVKTGEEEGKVPGVMLELNCAKKGWEREVTVSEPWEFQTVSAS